MISLRDKGEAMKLVISGQTEEIAAGSLTVKELLALKNVETPEYVTVELNDEVLPRGDYDQVYLKDGDKLEFLYYMGGGIATLF